MSGPSQWIIMKIIWWLLDCKGWLKTYLRIKMKSSKKRNYYGRAKASDCREIASQNGILWCRKSSEWRDSIKCMKTTTMTDYAAFSSGLWGVSFRIRNQRSESCKPEEPGTSKSEYFSAVSYRACSIKAEVISKNALIFRRTAKGFWNCPLRWSKIWTGRNRRRQQMREIRWDSVSCNRPSRLGSMLLRRIASWGSDSMMSILCTKATASMPFSNCGLIWQIRSGFAIRFGERSSWKK